MAILTHLEGAFLLGLDSNFIFLRADVLQKNAASDATQGKAALRGD
jgi:hypothetical protein